MEQIGLFNLVLRKLVATYIYIGVPSGPLITETVLVTYIDDQPYLVKERFGQLTVTLPSLDSQKAKMMNG